METDLNTDSHHHILLVEIGGVATEIKAKVGRYILIKRQSEGAPVTVLSVYVIPSPSPTCSKFKFYQKVFEIEKRYRDDSALTCRLADTTFNPPAVLYCM